MGQFLRDEISTPLEADVYIGVTRDEFERTSPVKPLGFGFQFIQSLTPKALGRKMELNLFQILAKFARVLPGFSKRSRPKAPTPVAGMERIEAVNTAAFAMGETPSAMANCSARGLAKLAAAMANGGAFGDHQLLSADAHAALHDEPLQRNMLSFGTTFTQGGLATFPPPSPADSPIEAGLNRGREGFFGWMGLGGSVFQWHPEHKIGFGYVPTSLYVLDFVNERAKAYQAEVVRCVERMNASRNETTN